MNLLIVQRKISKEYFPFYSCRWKWCVFFALPFLWLLRSWRRRCTNLNKRSPRLLLRSLDQEFEHLHNFIDWFLQSVDDFVLFSNFLHETLWSPSKLWHLLHKIFEIWDSTMLESASSSSKVTQTGCRWSIGMVAYF